MEAQDRVAVDPIGKTVPDLGVIELIDICPSILIVNKRTKNALKSMFFNTWGSLQAEICFVTDCCNDSY